MESKGKITKIPPLAKFFSVGDISLDGVHHRGSLNLIKPPSPFKKNKLKELEDISQNNS